MVAMVDSTHPHQHTTMAAKLKYTVYQPTSLNFAHGRSYSLQVGPVSKPVSRPVSRPWLPTSKVMSQDVIRTFTNSLVFGSPLRLKGCLHIPEGVQVTSNPLPGLVSQEVKPVLDHTEHPVVQSPPDNTFLESSPTKAVNVIDTCVSQEVAFCLDSDSDFEASHSEYESDVESECADVTEHLPDSGPSYLTLVSSESGYFEQVPIQEVLVEEDDKLSEDEWSDSGSECTEFCSEMWDSFQTQALSPMVVCNRTSTTKQEPCNAIHNSSTSVLPNKVETRDQRDPCHNSGKHVSFKPDKELCQVHTIVAWEYAYRAARRGPWEQYARDRSHFRRRIDSVASVLEPCLSIKLSHVSVNASNF